MIDELTVYNRALSQGRNQTIYATGSVGKCPLPPTVYNQPTNLTVNAGSVARFVAGAVGSPLLGYQWSLNGTNISGANSNVLTLANVQFTNAGIYAVTVTNSAGLATSSNAVLIVQAPPGISLQPTNQTVAVGGSAAFSVAANGSTRFGLPMSISIPTALSRAPTNAVLAFANLQFTNSGYYSVKVTNLFGAVVSSNALLTVQSPPIIVTQPTNVIALVGGNPVITTAAIGSLPLSYQWSFNGFSNTISGATNAIFSITKCAARQCRRCTL